MIPESQNAPPGLQMQENGLTFPSIPFGAHRRTGAFGKGRGPADQRAGRAASYVLRFISALSWASASCQFWRSWPLLQPLACQISLARAAI